MALGNYNNNKRSSSSDFSVYSSLRFSNNQSEVDKTSLTFTMWNNMLGIQLSPIVTSADGNISYDKDNSITIWLSPVKAMMLSKEIERFINKEATNVGVHTRSGIITITDGSDFNIDEPCITIRKMDEDGQIISAYTYVERTKYHYTIDNFEERHNAEPSFEKHMAYDNAELELIKIQCEEYVKAMSMANAYATSQITNRQNKRIEYKINKIAESNGITFDNNSSGGYNKQSYFDSNPGNLANSDSDDFE